MKKIKPENVKKEDWDAVDSPPLSDLFLDGMKPVRETHPGMPSRVRGPQKAPLKKPVSLRLDESVINAMLTQLETIMIRFRRVWFFD